MATDPESGETEPKPVTDLIDGTGLKHLVDLTINGYVVTATGGHPFWVKGRGWVDAEGLNPGDLVLEADADLERVTAKKRYEVANATVHNLTVADLHTYYVVVGEPILVHNSNKACGGKAAGLAAELADDSFLKPGIGRNRVIKELHKRGFMLKGPSKGQGGLIYEHPSEGAMLRIHPKPARAYRGDPAAKHAGPWYYRYKGRNGSWGRHRSVPQ